MKRYTDYTKEELAKLNEGEIRQLIEIECMVNGASAYYEKPDLKPVEKLPEPDVEVFEVAGINFLDKDEAVCLLEFLRNAESVVRTDYDYFDGYNSSYKYVMKDEDVATLSLSKHYSKEKYHSMKEAIARKTASEKHNREAMELYNEKTEQYRELETEVNNAVCEAISYESRYGYAKGMFERYVAMSDGNVEVAKNFFKKTEYCEFLSRILEDGGYNAGTD